MKFNERRIFGFDLIGTLNESSGPAPVNLPPVLASMGTAQSDPSVMRHRACFEAGG